MIEWARLPGDLIFIIGGILPVVYLAVRMFAQRGRYGQLAPGAPMEEFTHVYEEETSGER